MRIAALPFTLACLFFVGETAWAQFNPGPNPISSAVTTAQTLASGNGSVTSTGNLSVSGGTVAVTVTGSSSITNLGTIQQSGTARAIRLNTNNVTLTLDNGSAANASAVIQSGADDAVQVNQSNDSATLNNYGTINATSGQALDWGAITTGTNTINNFSTGFLTTTGSDAVRPGVNGTVVNMGVIRALPVVPAGGSSPGSDGVDTQTNSGVQVTNSGLIEGRTGVTGGVGGPGPSYAITVTNQPGSTISGVNGSGVNIDGVAANVTATIINNAGATLKGTWDGISVNGDGDGIDVDGVIDLTNRGFIRALGANGQGSDGFPNGSDGIAAGGGTIVNEAGAEITAAITTGNATFSQGILIDDSSRGNSIAATTLTNRGLIKSDNGPAVVFISTSANSITNDAGGTIRGAGAAALGAAIQSGNGSDVIDHAGAIIGDNGLALNLGDGNDTLNITGGAASISGDISGGATGTDGMTIHPGAGNNFSYSGVISNFSSVAVNSGTVTLSGANLYSGVTSINGGTLLAQNTTGNATGGSAVAVQSGGTLGGNGAVGTVTVNSGGIVAPGNPVGRLTVNGDYTQAAGGALSIQLGGPTPATQHDQLTVTGQANIAGTLNVNLVNGFNPSAGATFQIITAGSRTGNFAAINSPDVSVRVDPNAQGFVLTVLGNAPAVVSAVSQKVHGTSGTFGISLPGIECRAAGAGGSHQVVVTFASAVTVGGVTVSSSNGLATATRSVNGGTVTVDLASVANAQTLQITLTNVNNGSTSGDVPISMSVLVGDTSNNGLVNGTDVGQTKNRAGELISSANFRFDVTANGGSVNGSDVGLVKVSSGSQLP